MILLLLFAFASFASVHAAVPSELSDFTACAAVGIPDWDAISHFASRVALSSPYGKSTTLPLFQPVFSSHSLTTVNESLTTLALFLHGLAADANTYFCDGLAASAGHSALVIAPWFGNEQVVADFWNPPGSPKPGESYSAFWSTSRWLTGGNLSPGATRAAQYTTSFDIMEALIRNITASGYFPNLKLVSLNGFSAGSQFFNRFMWASALGYDMEMSAGVPIRYLISDPGSFMYLSAERAAPECRPLLNTGDSWTCETWEIPPADANCADYDQYKYGIAPGNFGNLNAYLADYDTNATRRSVATARFPEKDVVFIFGGADACNCNVEGFKNDAYCYPEEGSLSCVPDDFGGAGCCDTYPDADTSNAMDVGCEAMLQGSNRLQRGLLFVQHLNKLFPARARGGYPVSVVEGMGHDNTGEYKSPAFQLWAFYE
jgi:hypothetical protein